MRSTSASGVTIRYDDRGAGEPALLLMPGWCVDRRVYSDLAPKLAERYRVVALDWRGHGESQPPEDDFDFHDLVQDALSAIEASGAHTVVPVAQAHAGWVAIELRRRLKERVPKLVLLDWLVGDPSSDFVRLLKLLQTEHWREARDRIFEIWTAGASSQRVEKYLHDVVSKFECEMWGRAARAVEQSYSECGSPLSALSTLQPPVPVLHLYAQPDTPEFADLQTVFARKHPWYRFQKLEAGTHFAMFECPAEIATAINEFVATGAVGKAA